MLVPTEFVAQYAGDCVGRPAQYISRYRDTLLFGPWNKRPCTYSQVSEVQADVLERGAVCMLWSICSTLIHGCLSPRYIPLLAAHTHMIQLSCHWPLVPFALALIATWILWSLFKKHIISSPLDNVPGPTSSSFWIGNTNDLVDRHGWKFHKRLAEEYDSTVVKIHGLMGSKGLYVFDPKALNSILVKDQTSYEVPNSLLLANHLTFGPNLLSVTGDHHRKQRKLLNPVFHINHMRTMTPLFYDIVHTVRH